MAVLHFDLSQKAERYMIQAGYCGTENKQKMRFASEGFWISIWYWKVTQKIVAYKLHISL